MPTTFNVISIGQLADMDTTEGNSLAEAAAALVGQTFGGIGDSLVDDFVELTPIGDAGGFYNQDNNPSEQFSINGGPAQTFDSTAIFNATITYIDGTTAQYSAVLFQDVDGNAYLSPEFSANADQTALEAGAIRSISLDSMAGNSYSGMTTSRESWNFVTCFVRGTPVETAAGRVPVEALETGDMVRTADNGYRPLRWVGRRRVDGRGTLAPVLIRHGALGNDCDLRVSPQHRMLLSGWRAEMFMGVSEVLAAAKHLVNDRDILRERCAEVEYFHIMFDRHELVYAAGIPSESFNPGAMAWDSLSEAARDEILTIFPELREGGPSAYGPAARPALRAHEARLLRA